MVLLLPARIVHTILLTARIVLTLFQRGFMSGGFVGWSWGFGTGKWPPRLRRLSLLPLGLLGDYRIPTFNYRLSFTFPRSFHLDEAVVHERIGEL